MIRLHRTKSLAIAITLAAQLGAVGCSGYVVAEPYPDAVVVVREPPPPRREYIIERPGPDMVWINGFWSWQGADFVWVGGRWAAPPRGHRAWVPGQWRRSRRGWFWVEGHWR